MTFAPVRLRPDAEAVARDILAASGVTVGANVPPDLVNRVPYVSCKRFGGASVHPEKLDRATIAVDAWSLSRPTAVELGETCASLLYLAWKHQTLHMGATVSSFVEVVAPAEIRTDGQADGLYRVTASFSLHVRPSR